MIWQHILYDICYFKFDKLCSIIQSDCSESLSNSVYMSVRSSWFRVLPRSTVILLIFCLPDVSITSRDAKVPNYKSIIYFFRFYQWSPDIYWHLVIGHKHINVISQNWLLYHFAMPLCIHDHFLCSEFCSIGNQYNYSSFTLRSVNVVYLSL